MSLTSRLALVALAPRDRRFQRRKSGAMKSTGPIGLRAPTHALLVTGSGRTPSPKRSRKFPHGALGRRRHPGATRRVDLTRRDAVAGD